MAKRLKRKTVKKRDRYEQGFYAYADGLNYECSKHHEWRKGWNDAHRVAEANGGMDVITQFDSFVKLSCFSAAGLQIKGK